MSKQLGTYLYPFREVLIDIFLLLADACGGSVLTSNRKVNLQDAFRQPTNTSFEGQPTSLLGGEKLSPITFNSKNCVIVEQ
mmetsp:Transcript_7762/g.16787  ORF Transcript_7762/g.16787 Transcript_7762/m.16787 type:complete len:81 (-) Transcript_7762:599-841(-)